MFYVSGRCEGTFCPRTNRIDLEAQLQTKLHDPGVS
jgi:hypothetical protein